MLKRGVLKLFMKQLHRLGINNSHYLYGTVHPRTRRRKCHPVKYFLHIELIINDDQFEPATAQKQMVYIRPGGYIYI